MANFLKSYIKFDKLYTRLRKKVYWGNFLPIEKRLVQKELQAEKLNREIDSCWQSLFFWGYKPQAELNEKQSKIMNLINLLIGKRDKLRQSISNAEKKHNLNVDNLLQKYYDLQNGRHGTSF